MSPRNNEILENWFQEMDRKSERLDPWHTAEVILWLHSVSSTSAGTTLSRLEVNVIITAQSLCVECYDCEWTHPVENSSQWEGSF